MSSLRDKTAIVTGGASGIGLAISTLFAEAGASVSILDFDEAAGSTAARGIESLGGVALPLKCDVSDSASIVEAVGVVVEKFGGIDILVNNAGVANIGTATTTSEEDFDRVMRVNVKGVYQCLNAILPVMVKSGGGVVLNMSSIAAVTGLKDRFAYSASKGAVHTMTYSIAADYLEHGIRCNSICPARVHTPFVDGYLEKNYPDNKEEMFQKLSAVQPIGRMAKPDEIAKLALYLCSEDSSYITGQSFNIDGGYLNLRP
ncbi:MAG: SDR family NAD(P)-dependent oxidoreductase [Verrucomicrobiales bacterium]|jgi:NAD(P)-dependent dehydrogenase (short-subunit alcohol dehydrogenase family)|nr:SDR family NAD(P)-dependent oxidoreductase [Verrucomicrobiales bacterium]